MDAADYVVKKIVDDALNQAGLWVAEAKKRASGQLRDAKKEAEQQKETNLFKAKLDAKDLKNRSLQLAAVEQRKAELAAKHAILDTIYKDVRAELLVNKNYKELIKNLIINHCSCDACIVISKNDEKVLTEEFIKTCGANIKCRLTRRVGHNFQGGIIIESGKYDISLTLDDLLKNAREQTEVEVTNILWR